MGQPQDAAKDWLGKLRQNIMACYCRSYFWTDQWYISVICVTWDKTGSRVLIFYARPITLWVFRWNYVAQGLDFANSKAKVRVQHEILWLRWVTDLFKFQKTYGLCLDLLRAFDNIKLPDTGAISNKNQLWIEPRVTTEIHTGGVWWLLWRHWQYKGESCPLTRELKVLVDKILC